jgi:DNA-binding SARP family transcriptional activator
MTLTVSLLGPPRVERDGAPVSFDTRKALALLAYLALAERPHARDALAELLWPGHDDEHARGALRRTLSALRSAIGAEHLDVARERIALAPASRSCVDVHRFRRFAGPGASAADLERAAQLCSGELLEGFALRDSPAFDEWQRLQADGLRRELSAVLDRAADTRAADGDFAGALAHARRRLALDPLQEPAHRLVIRLLAWSGDRAAAVDAYRDCVRLLSAELGVAPLPETTNLYRAISEGDLEPPPEPRPTQVPAAAPRAPRPLVGRGAQWEALVEAHRRASPGGRVVVLEGEPGIGKTRLA